MGKTYDKWKELEMKIKVIAMAVALFSSLGFGGSLNFAWGFFEQLQQNDIRHDNNIQILTEETIMLKYNIHKERLTNEIKAYKKDLFDLRKEYGGSTGDEALPLGDAIIKQWYNNIEDKLKEARVGLNTLEKEIESFQDPLKNINQGEDK